MIRLSQVSIKNSEYPYRKSFSILKKYKLFVTDNFQLYQSIVISI